MPYKNVEAKNDGHGYRVKAGSRGSGNQSIKKSYTTFNTLPPSGVHIIGRLTTGLNARQLVCSASRRQQKIENRKIAKRKGEITRE